jgi:hypothetical protein
MRRGARCKRCRQVMETSRRIPWRGNGNSSLQEGEFWIRWEAVGPTPGLSKSPGFANLPGLGILVPGATHPPCFP